MRRSEATRNAAFMRLPLPERGGQGWRLSTNARLISPFETVLFMRSFQLARSFIILPYMAGQTVSVGGQKEKNLLRLKKQDGGAITKTRAAPQKRPKKLRIAVALQTVPWGFRQIRPWQKGVFCRIGLGRFFQIDGE